MMRPTWWAGRRAVPTLPAHFPNRAWKKKSPGELWRAQERTIETNNSSEEILIYDLRVSQWSLISMPVPSFYALIVDRRR